MGGGFVASATFEAEFRKSDGLRPVLQDRVDAVAKTASAIAADDPSTSGLDLHRDIKGEVGELEGYGLIGRVNAYNWKAHWYEFGASNTAARPFLRPALEQEVGPQEASPIAGE